MHSGDDRVLGWALIAATILLVLIGCGVYIYESVGWAQLCWVLASGTAGAGVVLVIGGKR